MKIEDLKITILFDNLVNNEKLTNLWGFSCLIEAGDRKILMDTGSNGRVLLDNMKLLNISPAGFTDLFISHHHWDHIGGIDSIIELNPQMRMFLPSGLSMLYINDLKKYSKELIRVNDKPIELARDIYSTGTINCTTPEQILVIDTDKGLIIITGCAHPGLDEIIDLAIAQHQKPIYLLAGGFHYMRSSTEEIEEGMKMLEKYNIKHILPTHCTGKHAVKLFREKFNTISGGAGKVIKFPL